MHLLTGSGFLKHPVLGENKTKFKYSAESVMMLQKLQQPNCKGIIENNVHMVSDKLFPILYVFTKINEQRIDLFGTLVYIKPLLYSDTYQLGDVAVIPHHICNHCPSLSF